MKKFKNTRTLSLLAWIIVTVLTVITMPDMDQLVRDKGQITIPDSAQSEVAKSMINNMDEDGSARYQIISVFNSGNDEALTDGQKEEIEAVITDLKAREKELGITGMMSHLDSEETEKQLVSEDGTTILTQISIDKNQGTITEVAEELNKAVQNDRVETYLTGNDIVMEDFVQSTQEGVKKTEIIAVVFIIVVLILVFRSPIVPVVSLLTVGISYAVSMGIIAHLVDLFNFPFSNFTQVFLVVILFGIGTDYNILLYTRFKEELSKQESPLLAVKETFKSSGKTVLYSGIAVFIGFMALFLAEFKLYQASSAVAIGVAVLILVLNTLNPFFMVLLGKKMFWPVKRFEGHGDSRIWAFLSKNSVIRPISSIILVIVLCLPFLMKYSGDLSYNDLLEVDDAFTSKQGINIIEDHFSPGFSSPASVVIKSDEKMDDQQYLQALDELAEEISKVDGVANVFSPTRPSGEKINDLYINDQTQELNTGLGDTNSGIGQINDGLSSAERQMGSRDSSGLDNVQTLIDGTSEVKKGVSSLQDALNQVTDGMNDGAQGAQALENGLVSLNENVGTLSSAASQLSTGYTELQAGLSSFSQHFDRLAQAIEGARQGFEQIEASMESLIQSNPDLAEDPNVQQTIGIASAAQQQLDELSTQLNQLTPQYNLAIASFQEANTSLAQVKDGLAQVQSGVSELQTGASSLNSGLTEGAEGSAQIASKTSDLESGLTQINGGQEQLLAGLADLEEQMATLQSGISESTKGLDEVSEGLNGAQDYLSGLSESQASQKFYIPKDVLEGSDYQEALDMYMSNDRQTAQMTVILDVNPYSREAMTIIRDLDDHVDAAIKGSELSDATVAIGGKTSQNTDLQDISSNDFARTATIMLIGIGLVLIFITRSFWQPIFIIGSLVLAYYTSLGISEIISTNFLGVDALGWNVPFFSFIMIVALGVDYSIFLMMRYRELEGDALTAIVDAARHIGGVVISAAIILGGTFAALIPSGVLTLIQVAMVVIIGLFILSLVMLPILIPALMGLTHKLNSSNKEEIKNM
ncbi:MMPL family transporter [Jeotgalibacillus soli]|uniref:Membrane transport protein MMPL domain-containing protein n=1 Tax=Jeotgalibacillus soli TaxID=889306 RepID=A0A0C2VY09_9BACL|nr:MMPL family transporter [Jeotgalibacillus soli]KIL49306.1 hypothetical protein KP78_07740 [Jeotgalibacillus soli]